VQRVIVLLLIASLTTPAQDALNHSTSDCVAFGPKRETAQHSQISASSQMTVQVAALLPPIQGKSTVATADAVNLIDTHIFDVMQQNGVKPAAASTDWEFIRRITLDLTGRLPDSQRVISFVNDKDPDKPTKLIDELLAKPEWVDKWAMYFGDLYKNNSTNAQIRRYVPGVVAFNKWIRESLTANKPYDRMTRELIAASGTDSYAQGELNWLAGGFVTGGPVQDVWDQQAANTAEAFLGVSSMNCVLCHNGRGHLDTLSLWGRNALRTQGWGLASFFSRTETLRTRVNPEDANPYYWRVQQNTTRYRTDYPLNTTTGNRPAREPLEQPRQTTYSPVYPFAGNGTWKPAAGEDYRVALGRFVTQDFQFARATVNYMWEAMFGLGLVSPSNQFDLARLDPENPPANCPEGTPCELQASHPRLLNELAQTFIDSKYDLKKLQRLMVTSRAYQLSSRYEGEWNPLWSKLFARKQVRRLMGEEIHDAIASSSQVIPTYNNAFWGPVNWAMKLPEPLATPDGPNGAVARFLNAFLRGDRDDEPRRGDGAIAQTLGLMNDPFVMTRIRSTTPNGLLARTLTQTDENLVNILFLNALSRYPNDTERATALANLKSGNRTQEAENLFWSLYNKVDFIFNY